MNKKFSTLLAGAALLSAVSVNAQKLTAVEEGEAIQIGSAAPLQDYNDKTKGGLYQLKTNDGYYLLMEEDNNGNYVLKARQASDAAFKTKNSLWCVSTQAHSQGQNVKFDFTNKATGLMLDIAMNGSSKNAHLSVLISKI